MQVYFVRHGATNSYQEGKSQKDTDGLSDEGKNQAQELAKRFKDVTIDMIISSPLARALETAKTVGSNVIVSQLFAEVRKPSQLIGRDRNEPEVVEILDKIRQKYLSEPTYHYSDEENFEDIKKRGLEALSYLKSLNKENVLVVTHGNFLGQLMGIMMYGADYPAKMYLKLKNFLRISNTGVTIVIYENETWQLKCWNDTGHF